MQSYSAYRAKETRETTVNKKLTLGGIALALGLGMGGASYTATNTQGKVIQTLDPLSGITYTQEISGKALEAQKKWAKQILDVLAMDRTELMYLDAKQKAAKIGAYSGK